MKLYKTFLTLDDAELKILERLCVRCQLAKYSYDTGMTTVLYGWAFDKRVMKAFKETRTERFKFTTTKIDKCDEEEVYSVYNDDPILKDYKITFAPLVYEIEDMKTRTIAMTELERKSIKNFMIELINERISNCRVEHHLYTILKSKYYDALKNLEFFSGVTESNDYGIVIPEFHAFMYLFEFIL